MFDQRLLPQRARLEFHYPTDDMIIFLPFYENPTITETQTANYAEYNPVGRAGSLYAYTGAKSRKIKLKLKYTLPHLAFHDMGINKFMRIFMGQGNVSQQLLFTKNTTYTTQQTVGDIPNSLSLAVEKVYLKHLSEGGFLQDANGTSPNITNVLNTMEPTERNQVIDTLLFFLALFRTSVTNKATDPMHGPPLIRLNFGTMYQSVPCICKNYNITWEEEGGYDLETLTPRKLLINLQLDEVRVGDFTTYEPAEYVVRDNLTGWESAVNSPYTTDPLTLGSLG